MDSLRGNHAIFGWLTNNSKLNIILQFLSDQRVVRYVIYKLVLQVHVISLFINCLGAIDIETWFSARTLPFRALWGSGVGPLMGLRWPTRARPTADSAGAVYGFPKPREHLCVSTAVVMGRSHPETCSPS